MGWPELESQVRRLSRNREASHRVLDEAGKRELRRIGERVKMDVRWRDVVGMTLHASSTKTSFFTDDDLPEN